MVEHNLEGTVGTHVLINTSFAEVLPEAWQVNVRSRGLYPLCWPWQEARAS